MSSLLKNFGLGSLGLSGRKERYVAFDIGSSSVKMVEAGVDRSGWRLFNVGVVALPTGAVQNNMVVETRVVADALRKLISDKGVKRRPSSSGTKHHDRLRHRHPRPAARCRPDALLLAAAAGSGPGHRLTEQRDAQA